VTEEAKYSFTLTQEVTKAATVMMQGQLLQEVVEPGPNGGKLSSILDNAPKEIQMDVKSCLVHAHYAFVRAAKYKEHFLLNICLLWWLYQKQTRCTGPKATTWVNKALIEHFQSDQALEASWVPGYMAQNFGAACHFMGDVDLACSPDLPSTVENARAFWATIINTSGNASVINRFRSFTAPAREQLRVEFPDLNLLRSKLTAVLTGRASASQLGKRLEAAGLKAGRGKGGAGSRGGAAAAGFSKDAPGASASPDLDDPDLSEPRSEEDDPDDFKLDSPVNSSFLRQNTGRAMLADTTTERGGGSRGRARGSGLVRKPRSLSIGQQLPPRLAVSDNSLRLARALMTSSRHSLSQVSHEKFDEFLNEIDDRAAPQPRSTPRVGSGRGARVKQEHVEDQQMEQQPVQSDGAAAGAAGPSSPVLHGVTISSEDKDQQLSDFFEQQCLAPSQHSQQEIVGWVVARRPSMEHTSFLLNFFPELRRALDEDLRNRITFYGGQNLDSRDHSCPLQERATTKRRTDHVQVGLSMF